MMKSETYSRILLDRAERALAPISDEYLDHVMTYAPNPFPEGMARQREAVRRADAILAERWAMDVAALVWC